MPEFRSSPISDGAAPRLAEASSLFRSFLSGKIGDPSSLGWLEVEKWASDHWLRRLADEAGRLKSLGDTFVLIGVGGSNNSTRAVEQALRPEGMKIVYMGNTLSPLSLSDALSELDGRDFVCDCVAKNFATLEPGSSFRLLRDALRKRYGEKGAAERTVVTGTEGCLLHDLAKENGWTFIPFPGDIGGRFTALSPVHLLPLACAGVDIAALRDGAAETEAALRSDLSEENPAVRYAAARAAMLDAGRKVEILSVFEPRLAAFTKWWEQLVGESEGKGGKGTLPKGAVFSEELHSLGQFIQDGSPVHYETFLRVGDAGADLLVPVDGVNDAFSYLDGKGFREINRAAEEATMAAHAKSLPVMEISVPRLDEASLGSLFYFFEVATALTCALIGVDAFTQDGVEEYKRMMFRALGKE